MAGGGLRGGLGVASIVLIGGALLLMLLVILSGVKDHTPLNKTYFLKADTSSFPGSGRAESYWTFWKVCATPGGQCGATVPDMPIGAAWVGGNENVPANLVGKHYKGTTSTYYYFLWRFGWAFYLIALVGTAFTFLISVAAPFSRLASGLSGIALMLSMFGYSVAAALMTVHFVKARDEFRRAGISAALGRYAFGFTWAAWFCMLIATIFLFLGCGVSRKDDNVRERRSGGMMSSVPFFRRQRSKRSTRGSFIDTESQRRVKEEY